jgi:hypothetical protein
MSAHTYTANRWMKPLPLLGLLLAAAPGIQASMLRARQAEAARWNAMAKNFAARQASNLERARLAEAARYTGLAANYAARQAANLERARIADAARWNLIVKYFAINP